MDKKKYEQVTVDIILLSGEDVVRTSGLGETGGDAEGENDYFLPVWIL